MTLAVLVAPAGDDLAVAVGDGLSSLGDAVRTLEPEALGDARLTLDSGSGDGDRPPPELWGEAIGAVLWRGRPDGSLGRGWAEGDGAFADAEVRSAWLAVLDHPSVLSVNRFGADMWFEGAGWPSCRRRMSESGVPMAPLAYGATSEGPWLPFCGRTPRPRPPAAALRPLGAPGLGAGNGGRALALFGRVREAGGGEPDAPGAPGEGEVRPPRPATGPAAGDASLGPAAAALDGIGIHLAMLFTDSGGRLRWIDPLPVLQGSAVTTAATEIAGRMHAHLRGR